jgi:hypothetical protein
LFSNPNEKPIDALVARVRDDSAAWQAMSKDEYFRVFCAFTSAVAAAH